MNACIATNLKPSDNLPLTICSHLRTSVSSELSASSFPRQQRTEALLFIQHSIMAFLTLYYRPLNKARANHVSRSSAASTPASSRPRRSGPPTASANVSSATVQRGSGTSNDRRQSLKLTVKAPPSKLREVMRVNEADSLLDTLGGGKVLDGPRSSRRTTLAARVVSPAAQRSKYAEFGESDIEDDDEEDEDVEEEQDKDQEDAPNDFDELGAEPEGGTDDEDEDEDIEMEDAPPPPPPPKRQAVPKPPKITLKPPAKTDPKQPTKPKLVVTPAKVGPLMSVEDQEMEDDPDDDEVEESSDLSDEDDDEDEDDEEEEEEQTNLNDEDAEGEEEEVVADQDALAAGKALGPGEDDDDDLDDSSDETPVSGAATPDQGRMTKRQRGRPEDEGHLMALDMAPQQRKV